MTQAPSPPAVLALRLLGPPGVALDGRAIALGSRKAVALLGVLALDGPCARSRLAALLWPEHDDAGARRNLRREVFRLRNAGVPLDDGEAQSLALSASATCDALVAGARGGILFDGFDHVAGDAFTDWLGAWRARLAQRSRQDIAEAVADHERHGDWRGALTLHLRDLDTDPTNESAAQHALRMYAKLGERDAGLALFARLESQLRLQLGLAPLAATRELVAQLGPVATSSPAADATAPGAGAATRSPLPARAPFTGRVAEQRQVRAGWDAGRTVFLAGPPGVGKSRLAAECAAAAGAALFVNCRPDDTQLAYSSAVRALRALLEAAPDLELPPWVTRELTRLLPELGPPPEGGDASEAAGDEARLRLFGAYAQAWLLLAEENFNVVVIDDWQFADAASLQMWSFVDAHRESAGARRSAPVRRLVAYRVGELGPASLGHVRQLVDAGAATLLTLDGLPQADVQSLVQRLASQPGAALFAQRLHDATDGNPLFVLETIRHLFERQLLSVDPAGGWRTPFDAITTDYAELPVPLSVRETLLARVHALGDGAARLLQAASLAGDSFDLAMLAGTAALDELDTVAALERAAASQILRVGDDGACRFAHDLYRQCVADGLSPARRALLHGRLARNLAAAGGTPARVARHFEQAQLRREAAPWFVQAGAESARVYDIESALAHYARALELGLEPGEAYEIRDRRVLLLHRLHRNEEQLQELTLMAELARATDNPAAPYDLAAKRAVTLFNSGRIADALAQARWIAEGAPTRTLVTRAHYLAGVALLFLADDTAARTELEAALADAPAVLPDWVPMICAFLCHLAVSRGDLETAQRHFEDGRAAATPGRPLSLADVLNAGSRVAEAAGNRALAIERLAEANALGIGVGDVTLRINYLFNLIVMLLNDGDLESARTRRAEVMALLVGKTDPRARFIEEQSAGRIAVCEGDLGRAWTAMTAAFDAAVMAGEVTMQRSALIARAHLAADCGEHGLVDEALVVLAATGPHHAERPVRIEHALRACCELAAGDAAAAVARLRRTCEPPALPAGDHDWQENAELAQITLSRALAATGDIPAARATLPSPRFSPRLRAMAAEAALAIADAAPSAPDAGDAAIELARAQLDAARLTPLEAARLWRSLAMHHGRGGEAARAAAAGSRSRDLIDRLLATLSQDDASVKRLRAALATLRPD